MTPLDAFRVEWLKVRNRYEAFGQVVATLIASEIRRVGMLPIVSFRAKAVDSYLKKIMRKGYTDPLNQMHDKVGVRIVVPFISQLPTVDDIVRRLFDVKVFEDKLEGLGHDKFAYQSWHYDILPKEPVNRDVERYRGWWCELQLRTESQNLWAEMAHRLIYKNEQDVPGHVARRVHLLNALLELADREFEGSRNMINNIPGAWAASVLSGLEGIYYELMGREFDRELSLGILEHLRTLCDIEPPSIVREVKGWVEAHRSEVDSVVAQYEPHPDRVLLLFQPEAFLILYLVAKDRFGIRDRWSERFPDNELRSLTTAFGLAVD